MAQRFTDNVLRALASVRNVERNEYAFIYNVQRRLRVWPTRRARVRCRGPARLLLGQARSPTDSLLNGMGTRMMTDLMFRLTLFVLMAGGMVASATFRQRADREGGVVPRSADGPVVACALGIGGLAVYGAILAWLAYPPLMGWAGVTLPDAIRWLGAVMVAGGMATGLWALSYLGRNVTPTAVPRADADLVTTGPYRWVRHPLYSSGLLTIPGCALLAANWFVLLAGLLSYGVVLFRTQREEEGLVARFGQEYLEYKARTGRIVPNLNPFRRRH